MLNKYLCKIISILLTMIFITGIFPPVVFSQPNPSPLGEVKGFNRAVIDSHFSKADRELSPERWLEEAKFGVTQAINAWEFIAVNFYENPLLYEEAKNQLLKWSDEELEKRFSQWLMGRFFGKAAEEAYLNLSKMFNESQKNYSWHLDDEGNVIFDDKTGDPLVIRPDEEGREFSRDLTLWRGETDEIVNTTGASFNNVISNLYPELLAYIPVESRGSMSEIFNESFSYQKGAIKREFENIAAREERIFTNRRTRDIWSLRKKRDDEAAGKFTERLIAETNDSCKRGIEEINSRIEQAAAGTGDLALLGEEWLRLYTEQFERGLKAWEDAEERFFIRRIEWEQESFKLLSEGEDLWLSAFEQFEKERQNWELNAKELFKTGETLFKTISEDFEKTIAEAKKEFELNIAIRIAEGTNKVKALIDMYLVYASAAISLMDNIKFWQKQYGDSEKDIRDSDFQDWILQEIENVWKNTESAYLNDPIYINDLIILEQMKPVIDPEPPSSEDTIIDIDIDTEIDIIADADIDEEIDPEFAEALRIYNIHLDEFNIKYSELLLVQNIILGEFTLPEQIVFAETMNSNHFPKNKFDTLIQIQNYYNTYLLYAEKSLEARDRIYENYAELFGTGALKDILSSDASSDDFYLDEFQIALIRAKAVVLYWERKTSIADSVMAYAVELNAGRMTEAEGIRAWENAKAAYNESLTIYETELNKLKKIGENVQEQQRILNNMTLQMQREEDKLNTLYSDYTTLISVSVVNLDNNYFRQFNDKYNSLKEKYNKYLENGVNSVYYSTLEYGMLWGIAEQQEIAELILYKILTDDDLSDEEIESLTDDYNFLSPISQNNLWNAACSSLSVLLNNYNLQADANMLPGVQSICLAIFNKSGDFAQNTAQFLTDFDNCFSAIPTWLQYEIYNWKEALIEYISIYALFNNYQPENNTTELSQLYDDLFSEYDDLCDKLNTLYYTDEYTNDELNENADIDDSTDDEAEELTNSIIEIIDNINIVELKYRISKSWETLNSTASAENEIHWRQYLVDNYISNKDNSLAMVSSWTAGVLADALFYANYCTNRINDSFYIYSQRDQYNIETNAEIYYYLYSEYKTQILNNFNLLTYQYNEITNASKAYTFSILPPEGITEQLLIVEENIKTQEEALNLIRDEYFEEAEKFIAFGSQYDNQYNSLKILYNNTDQKRFEYEKQDAIQRWANTSYLSTDNINPDSCRTNLSKAQNVLNVLSDISNNENRTSTNNPEYDALYAAYEQSFTRKLKALEAMNTLSSAYMQELMNNEKIYYEYQNSLHQLGRNFNYENYLLPDSKSDWKIENIITVKNGRLAFSRDDSLNIIGVDSTEVMSVIDFFNSNGSLNSEQNKLTSYEEALRGLSQRMSEYFKDPNKFMQWGYARNYLLLSLINSNSDLNFLNSYLSLLGELGANEPLGSELIKKDIYDRSMPLYTYMQLNFYNSLAFRIFDIIRPSYNFDALSLFGEEWNKLSTEEKADLEFYVILTLTTGGDYFTGFSKMYTNKALQFAYNNTYDFYDNARKKADAWYLFLVRPAWIEVRDINKNTYERIKPVYLTTSGIVNTWITELKNNLDSISNLSSSYAESCLILDELMGTKTENSNIVWDDLEAAFLEAEIKSENIAVLKACWEEMLEKNENNAYTNIFEALAALSTWTDNEVYYAKNNLEIRLKTDLQNQKLNENTFLSAVDNYFNGTSNLNTVIAAAENAYGNNNISERSYLDNMYNTLINSLSMYMYTDFNFSFLFDGKKEEIILLTAETISNKYNSELSAREAEWDLMRKDITEKYDEWQKTAALILENGRTDWTESYIKLENAHKQWNLNFQSEYDRVNNEWNLAYLAGLEDKEMWLQQAADAANQASSESFLSLLGTEGERLSRFVDTREPFGIRDAIPETQALMNNLLQSSGIINMAVTFNSINNFSGVTSPLIKHGIGGSSWDSALIKIAASDLARETNAIIADGESKKLAYNVRIAADEAVKSLTASVNTANQSFRESMDNTFIFKGLWRRSGNGYTKDIIKGSTILKPVITETAYITGYRNYIMEPVTLKTNLDEKFLAGLNTIAIQGLMDNVYVEVQTIAGEIFGINKDIIKINRSGNEREQSPGLFGAHIGYGPAVKKLEGAPKNRDEIFDDEGAGELGRLLSDFQYWYIIDQIGSAELSTAPWDKRIWDDEGSWFTAPSLRTVGAIAGSIAAGIVSGGTLTVAGIALSVGLCSASEIAFGLLDVSGGYKGIDEVAVNIGKTILTNTLTSAAGGLFNGINIGGKEFQGITNFVTGKTVNPFDTVLTKTFMTGTQTFTTGFATSLVSGITYNSEDSFGFSGDIFRASMKGVGISSLTSMTSVFTTTGLTAINSGLEMDKLTGFNRLNQADLQNFNGLIGSLAGQGVNYALGNDFTLNIFNLSLLTGSKDYSGGLLELHLGRNGVNMNFGTGGANVSIDNLISAYRGAQVWNVNTKIGKYGDKNDFNALISLRAQYGYGDDVQKNQLQDILKGSVIINTNAEGDYFAETTINEDGKRVINLAAYEKGMSKEDQFLLAMVLGHEAYRDGYITGEIDSYGNLVTNESQFNELSAASIARVLMGDRIQEEHNWFYDVFEGAAFESYLLNLSKETDNLSSFYEYLDFYYNNDRDYLLLSTKTGGDYQNAYRGIPLFFSATDENKARVEEQRAWAAYQKYSGHYFSYSNYNTYEDYKKQNADEFEKFKQDEDQLKKGGYIEASTTTISIAGCMFMSTKYGLEAILDEKIDTLALHSFIRENNLIANGTDNCLSRELIAEIITAYIKEKKESSYTVQYMKDFGEKPTIETLNKIESPDAQYIIHLRVGNPDIKDPIIHSVTVSSIEYSYDNNGNIDGIIRVNVANPYKDADHFNGKQSYLPGDIKRWDIFLVTDNRPKL
jgi:hypothetical protein